MGERLGRVFRLMGLPLWTLLGVGLSGVFVNYIGIALEVPIAWLLDAVKVPTWLSDLLSPLLIIALIAFAVFVMALALTQRQRRGVDKSLGPLGQPEGKQGLVLSVSRVDSAMHAIIYHYLQAGTLEHIWLIPSGDQASEYFAPSSLPVAIEIREACQKLVAELKAETGKERPLTVHDWHRLVSPADAQDTYEYVERVYRNAAPALEIDDSDIIVDFTGGTKPMSVGMVMACLRSERSLEYVTYDPESKTMHGPFLIDYQYSAFNLIG